MGNLKKKSKIVWYVGFYTVGLTKMVLRWCYEHAYLGMYM